MHDHHQLLFPRALVANQWAEQVLVDVENGVIRKIETGVAQADDRVRRIQGVAIPAMTNVHSHAFQRAFAGLSEYRTAERDSFWTWRQLMYEYLQSLTPDDVYNIARGLYTEMIAAGYSAVGEFHYLHHQVNGDEYKEIAAMADAIVLAALDAGINICMLPVFYERGGFDDSPLEGGQLRFGSSTKQYLRILESLHSKWHRNPHVRLGVALHSLRAVHIASGLLIVKQASKMLPGCPIHIHVAEQTGEVDDCLKATGKRPVELLLDSFDVDQRWCLIHATHMTEDECRRVAHSGAVVGVCPTTEANLGDGIFAADQYLNDGGRLAIGSDSHVTVDPRSELRLLEYAQRLVQRRRAVLCTSDQSCGQLLYRWASAGGSAVTGFGNGQIAVDQPLAIAVLDSDHVVGAQTDGQRVLDQYIFNEIASPVIETLIE